MDRTNIQSSIVPDAVAIIAVCATSRPLAEMAVALKLISDDELSWPSEFRHTASKWRIAQTVSSLYWRVEARTAMRDPDVQELAFLFYQICLQRVPTNSPNPLTDEDWLLRVRDFFLRQKPLQLIAGDLLDQFPMPETYEEAIPNFVSAQAATESIPVPTAPAAVPATPISPQPIVATNSPPSTSPKQGITAELVARLELIAKAKRFVDEFKKRHEANQARIKAAQAEEPHPAPTIVQEKLHTSSVPEPEPMSKSIQSIAVHRRVRRREPLRHWGRSNGNTKHLRIAVVHRSATQVHCRSTANASLSKRQLNVPLHDKLAFLHARGSSSRWRPMLRVSSRISGKAWYIRGSTRASGG